MSGDSNRRNEILVELGERSHLLSDILLTRQSGIETFELARRINTEAATTLAETENLAAFWREHCGRCQSIEDITMDELAKLERTESRTRNRIAELQDELHQLESTHLSYDSR